MSIKIKKITKISNEKTYQEALFQMGCLYNAVHSKINKRLTPTLKAMTYEQMDAFLGGKEQYPQYMEELRILICAYEKENPPLPKEADAIDYITLRLEQMQLPVKRLETIVGSSTNIYDILNRKADIGKNHIRKLYSHLGIPSKVLVKEVRFSKE